MNVAADHAVGLVSAGGLGHRAIAEVGQVFDGLFDPALEISGKLTVALAPQPAVAIVPAVDAHRGQIGLVTHPQEPAIRIERAVELMAVDHEHPASFGGLMNQFAQNGYRANKRLNQVGAELVMIAGQKHDASAASMPRRYLFDHRGLRRAPVPRRAEHPAVDDVTDQVKVIGPMMAQEVVERFGLAARGAEMQVGNPDRAIIVGCRRRRRGGAGEPFGPP